MAVIDTGIAYEDRDDFVQVPDLAGARFVEGYDFVNDTTHPNDDNGHGTHVAGTIAQRTNNGVGVAGVAFEARLMPLKVLDRSGIGNSADIADAIRWAVDHGAKVLNLSLGGPGYSGVMERAVAYARSKGAVVVCAAGNSGQGQVSYPAAYAGAVAVGAVGPDGQLAPYSSYGEALDIVAPGGNTRLGPGNGILQATIDRSDFRKPVLAEYQGTSMATPHVAGVAALLFAAGAKSPDEVERALYAGAQSEGAWTPRAGHGRLDALGALNALGKTAPGVDWTPLVWSAALLALLLLSLQTKVRPGFLNVLLNPATLLPLLLSTVGLWFLKLLWQRFIGHPPSAAEVLSLPLPDWERILFGRGRLASPVMYSALVPAVTALVAREVARVASGRRRIVARVLRILALRGLGEGPGHRLPSLHVPRPTLAGAQRAPGRAGLPGDAPEGGAAMKVRGTVEFRDIEMGVWVLAGDDGKTYQLAGGRSSLLKEGQRVEVDGDVDSGGDGRGDGGPGAPGARLQGGLSRQRSDGSSGPPSTARRSSAAASARRASR